MSTEHSHGWQLVDAAVYCIAGITLGVLLAVVIGGGRLPRIDVPDTPAELLDTKG